MNDIKHELLEAADQSPGWRRLLTAAHDHIAAQDKRIAELEAQLEALSKGVKISIPTATMEQEFATHYRRGYAAGVAVAAAANAITEPVQTICKGTNCSAADGKGHSKECVDEHDASISALECIPESEKNPDAPKFWYSNYSEDELANLLATKIPESSERIQWRGSYYKLPLPASASALAIVQDALEAAAVKAISILDDCPTAHIAQEIRAIDPQSIIDSTMRAAK